MRPCPYKRIRALGEGAVGDVHLSVDLEGRRLVVVKWLRAEVNEDSEAASRFRREAALMSGKHFAGVIQVQDYGVDEYGRTWMAMEFVDGFNPAHVIQTGDCWSIARLLDGVGRSLDELNGVGVVHRDLKPDNILVRESVDLSWEPVIIDLGIAKWLSEEEATATGSVFGTPHYMSPEQFRDAKHVGPATDRYALAVIAYELLTGRLPFDGRSLPELLRQHVEGTVPPLRLIPRKPVEPRAPTMHDSERPVPTPALDAFMRKAMAKTPQARFSSAAEMASAFIVAAQSDGVWYQPSYPRPLYDEAQSSALVIEGPSGVVPYDLKDGPIVLGRHERCQYVLASPRLSRMHAAIYRHRGRAWIGDLFSQNGTRLEGQQVTAGEPAVLSTAPQGNNVVLYDQSLRVVCG